MIMPLFHDHVEKYLDCFLLMYLFYYKHCCCGHSPLSKSESFSRTVTPKVFFFFFNFLLTGIYCSVLKNPPANAGDVGLILGWEDLLEKEMTTHSSILAWDIPWTEEPGVLQPMGSHKSWTQLSN